MVMTLLNVSCSWDINTHVTMNMIYVDIWSEYVVHHTANFPRQWVKKSSYQSNKESDVFFLFKNPINSYCFVSFRINNFQCWFTRSLLTCDCIFFAAIDKMDALWYDKASLIFVHYHVIAHTWWLMHVRWVTSHNIISCLKKSMFLFFSREWFWIRHRFTIRSHVCQGRNVSL